MQLERKHAPLYRLLKDYVEKKDLEGARKARELIVRFGLQSHPLLAPLLIRLCVLSRSLQTARQIFDSLPQREPSSWHAILHAYSKLGIPAATLSLFQQMVHHRVELHPHAFAAALKACTSSFSLDRGMTVHVHIIDSGYEWHGYLASALIDLYGKCTRLQDAWSVFDGCSDKSAFSMTALISGLVQDGQVHEALALFVSMQQQGLQPSHVTYVCVLKACSIEGALMSGRLCHTQLTEGNNLCVDDAAIDNTLVDLYSKCGSVEDAQVVFNAMPLWNVVACSALIMGYNVQGGQEKVLYLFQQLMQEGIEPDATTFTGVLSSCLNLQYFFTGKSIHSILLSLPCGDDISVGNALINMYAKCGDPQEARRVFDGLSRRDIVVWSSMFEAYAERDIKEAFILFTVMLEDGMNPDKVLYGSLLKVCTKGAALGWGRCLHSMILGSLDKTEMTLDSSIINMYLKCGQICDAYQVFGTISEPNMITWTALLSGCVQEGYYREVFQLYVTMQNSGLVPDSFALAAVLKAFSHEDLTSDEELLYEKAVQRKDGNEFELGQTIVNQYMTGGNFEDAFELFEHSGTQKASVLRMVINELHQHGLCEATLHLFEHIRQQGVELDTASYICVLKCCTEMAAFEKGKFFHAQIDEKTCEVDCFLANTLIDMYFKCGCLFNAETVFKKLAVQDVTAWTSMIAGYAENNDYNTALQYFNLMQASGLKPDASTFVSLLCACSNRGLIDEGCQYFEHMKSMFNITPTFDHYNCLVDLNGRVGSLSEARDVLWTMPVFPNLVAWMSLLSHCRSHGRIDTGIVCYENLVSIDESHASSYELMTKLYVDAGKINEAEQVQEKRKHTNVQKKVGMAFIEMNNKVSKFTAGCNEHTDLRWMLQVASKQLRRMGFIPLVDSVTPPDDTHKLSDWYGIL